MSSRSASVVVSQCVCKATPFRELRGLATASGWDLAELILQTGCGAQCGLCRPYLSRMLRTGETEFHEILMADDS